MRIKRIFRTRQSSQEIGWERKLFTKTRSQGSRKKCLTWQRKINNFISSTKNMSKEFIKGNKISGPIKRMDWEYQESPEISQTFPLPPIDQNKLPLTSLIQKNNSQKLHQNQSLNRISTKLQNSIEHNNSIELQVKTIWRPVIAKSKCNLIKSLINLQATKSYQKTENKSHLNHILPKPTVWDHFQQENSNPTFQQSPFTMDKINKKSRDPHRSKISITKRNWPLIKWSNSSTNSFTKKESLIFVLLTRENCIKHLKSSCTHTFCENTVWKTWHCNGRF